MRRKARRWRKVFSWGEGKGGIRTFIQEKRQRYLERLGISHSPSSADVPIEQPRMARSYYAEHIKTNGRLEIEVCKHVGPLSLTSHGFSVDGRDPILIRGRIQSRHRGSFRYFIYILIDWKRGDVEAVRGYCCSCPNGLRTVGCCSHIATVLWFLGLGQYLPEILISASFLDDCVESVGQE
jgi:hypothetical protein